MRRIGILFLLLTLAGCEGLGGIFTPPMSGTPTINSVTPSSSATNVSVGASVIAQLSLPNGGINQTTVDTNSSVRLTNTATGETVTSTVTVLNEAEELVLTPSSQLEFGTTYRFEMTSGVSDASGATFTDYSSTFTTVSAAVPSVTGSTPTDGAIDVAIDVNIATVINADGGVDGDTITPDSVYLVELDNGTRVDSNLGTTGGGDSITLQPGTLKPNTKYQFNITSAVTSLKGISFAPYTATFTTGSTVPGTGEPSDISIVPQSTATGTRYSSLAFDSSGSNLYATTIIGQIVRFPVSSDGTLGSPQPLTSVQEPDGRPRLTIGLTFDPSSTDSNPVVWVTHTALEGFVDDGSVANGVKAKWSGTLTRLSGPNLENAQDVVVGLPRSSKDHVTNSVAFNPAEPGIVYLVQGSNTAMGAPDRNWLYREESVLSGAVLRLDTNLLGGDLPLDAQTEDGGTYNPYAPNAPLTIYASGTRNSYDLVWHSNGNLYVPANGSAGGGNTPRYAPLPGTCENRPDGSYTGPTITDQNALPNYIATGPEGQKVDGWTIEETLNDYLFKIEKGGYYGTPNPKRCEWILNGGSVGFPGYPTTQRPEYPSGTSYDPNYRGPAGDFGKNISPDGAIEYKGNAFPDLKQKLLVTRYSGFDDVVAVTFGSDGKAVGKPTPIVPTKSFTDPLDIAQSPSTGYLYVSSYDENSKLEAPPGAGITLLRPR